MNFFISRLSFSILTFSVCVTLVTGISIAATSNSGNSEQKRNIKPETISVPYVTLRNKLDGNNSFENYYGGQRGQVQAGICNVTFSPIKSLQPFAEAAPFYIPDQKVELATLKEVSLDNISSEIGTLTGGDDENIILYLHGYNIGFWKSCRRAAMFQHELGLKGRLLLFSWPADGNALKYTWDESDLHWSVGHIAQLLDELIKKKGKGNVDVVAHSLGARGAFLALVRMACREPVHPLINELVLIAPDIDTEIFKQELSVIRQAAKRITLYASENDKALKLSQEVHGYPRLGQAGKDLSVMEGVDTIDISLVNSRRLSGHLYHLFSPEVIEDLTRLLHTGEPPEQRPSLRVKNIDGVPSWQLIPGGGS